LAGDADGRYGSGGGRNAAEIEVLDKAFFFAKKKQKNRRRHARA
jgi:hypothetical protein